MSKSISRGNKRLIFGIGFAVIFCLSYLTIASYMGSPEGLQYPNPGHYPGEIGPGTFNCSPTDLASGVCFWKFPAKLILGGILDMGNNKITNLVTPTANSDAATKGYVDAASGGGINWFDESWNYLGSFTVESGAGCQDWYNGGKGIIKETGLTIPAGTKEVAICTNKGGTANCSIIFTMTPPYSNEKTIVPHSGGGSNIHTLYSFIGVNPTGDKELLTGGSTFFGVESCANSDCSNCFFQSGSVYYNAQYKVSILENQKVAVIFYMEYNDYSYVNYNGIASGKVWYKT